MTSGDDLFEFIKLAGGPSAVIALGWWLRGQFVHVQRASERRMDSYEEKSERRHRQNLVRFAKINMKLGIADAHEGNGSSDADEP